MKIKPLLLIAALATLITSCTVQSPNLYTWGDYSNASYEFIKSRSEKDKEALIQVYDKMIKKQTGSRKTVPPGIYADYGYLLIQNGKTDQGKKMLEMEMELYPESKIFIQKILKNVQ